MTKFDTLTWVLIQKARVKKKAIDSYRSYLVLVKGECELSDAQIEHILDPGGENA